MIYAVGIDIVEIARIERARKKWRVRFTQRVFSEGERQYCEAKVNPSMHYAARFAAKEAFLKCISSGIWGGIRLRDIELCNDENGKPLLLLHNKARDVTDAHAITNVHVSISHADTYATAVVVLEKKSTLA